MHKLLIVSGLLFAASGCKNSNYCAGNPDNNCNEHPADAPKQIDGMEALDCTVAGCGDSGKVCDMATKACVECTTTASAACMGTSPVCKNDACTACEASADCASQACLGTGACEDASMVAYVTAGGTGDCLTPATSCGTVFAALATGRPVIRVSGTLTNEAIAIASGAVTLIGDDDGSTKIASTVASSTMLNVSGNSTSVTVRNISFEGAANNANGIQLLVTDVSHPPSLELDRVTIHGVSGVGVYSTGGMLTIDRANVAHNSAGGISLSSTTFHIKNVFVTDNGPAGTFGGMIVSQGSGAIEFATVVNNLGINDGNSRGISCVSTTTTVDSTLLQGNVGAQWGGTGCTFTYSNVYPDASPPTGTGNVRMQVTFAASNDYHLAAGSPMKDIANPASTVGDDVDGNSRPQGAVRDIGADELMP